MKLFSEISAWTRHIVVTWWNGGPNYRERIDYFDSRQLLRAFRTVVGVCALILGAASASLLFVDSARALDLGIRVAGAGVGMFWLIRWVAGPTPSPATATVFAFSSSVSIFLVSTTESTAVKGALGVSVLVLTATFAAFMLPARIFAAHEILAALAILYFAIPLAIEEGPVISIIKTILMILTVVGVPAAVQVGLVFLTQDAADSDTDQLCGTLNRRGFLLQSERALLDLQRRPRPNSTVGVLVLDHDHFKTINDTRGHAAGDAALVATAQLLRATTTGTSAVIGRTGGDEFAVLITNAAPQNFLDCAETIRRLAALEAEASHGRRPTVSIGICHQRLAAHAPAQTLLDSLITRADHAMYQAKQTGNAVKTADEPTQSHGLPTPPPTRHHSAHNRPDPHQPPS